MNAIWCMAAISWIQLKCAARALWENFECWMCYMCTNVCAEMMSDKCLTMSSQHCHVLLMICSVCWKIPANCVIILCVPKQAWHQLWAYDMLHVHVWHWWIWLLKCEQCWGAEMNAPALRPWCWNVSVQCPCSADVLFPCSEMRVCHCCCGTTFRELPWIHSPMMSVECWWVAGMYLCCLKWKCWYTVAGLLEVTTVYMGVRQNHLCEWDAMNACDANEQTLQWWCALGSTVAVVTGEACWDAGDHGCAYQPAEDLSDLKAGWFATWLY